MIFIRTNIFPVVVLAQRAHKIAQGGKFSKQTGARKDEIGLLSTALDRMAAELSRFSHNWEVRSTEVTTLSHPGRAESGSYAPLEKSDAGLFPTNAPDVENRNEPIRPDFEGASFVYDSAQRISTANNPEDVFRFLEEAFTALNYPCAIFDTNRDAVRLVTFHDHRAMNVNTNFKGLSIPVENSPKIFSDSGVILLDSSIDKKSSFFSLMSFFENLNCSSMAIFPILVNQHPVRIFVIGSHAVHPISSTEYQPFFNLAKICSNTLDRLTGIRSLQSQVEIYETLISISLTISTEFNLISLCHKLHEKVIDHFGSDLSFIIAMYDERTRKIKIPYLFEANKVTSVDSFPLDSGLLSILINKKQSLLLVRNTEHEAERMGVKILGKPAKSWLGVPLLISGEVIGAIILQDTRNEGRFTEKDLILFETLAPQVAIAIRNAQLIENLSTTLAAFSQETTFLHALLSIIPEKTYFKDKDGRYLHVSSSLFKDLNFSSAEEMIGKSDDELIPGRLGYLRHNEDMVILTTSSPSIGQLVERMDETGVITRELNSRIPIMDESGHPIGLLGISQNIANKIIS